MKERRGIFSAVALKLKAAPVSLCFLIFFLLFVFLLNNREAGDRVNLKSSTNNPISYQGSIRAASYPLPELDLESALAKNIENNFYFLRHKTSQRWPIASLTKLITAVIAYEKIDKSKTVDDLVKRMMIVSDNQAAENLANLLGRDKFIAAMKAKVEELGMGQTSIFDPTGLSLQNQSTIDDLEKLTGYIIKNHSQILQFSRDKYLYYKNKNMPSINQFAGNFNFLGGKTGYTAEARGNLLSVFQYQGQPILVIVLGTPNEEDRFRQTEEIFKWIFKFYR